MAAVSPGLALGTTALVLVAFAAAGVWYARGRVGSVEEYIAARESAGRGTLTATLVASSMGAWILFSPAEAGAAFGGIGAVLGYGLGSGLALAAYAVVGPRIRRLVPAGHGLTEYAYARYGTVFYAYVLVVSVAYMFVFLAAEFTGIAGALAALAGVPGWQTALLVGATALVYTGYGGLQASIATDRLQALVILPLLLVVTVVALFEAGGTGAVHTAVVAESPALLAPTNLAGVRFGLYVVVAVLGAEMLNQAWWQRLYAARDGATLRRGFAVAAVAVVPMVVLAGLFGPIAVGLGVAGEDPSAALFLVVGELLPAPLVLAVVVLAVLLVVSSADTLFNAIASVVTADLPRLAGVDEDRLTAVARIVTGLVALGATVVGAQGYSVLTLFLLADLLAAATFLPLYHGLYSGRASAAGALVASAGGLAVGLALFPPARAVLPAAAAGLPAPTFLRSFFGAAVVSGGLALATARIGDARFDLDALGAAVRRLDGGER